MTEGVLTKAVRLTAAELLGLVEEIGQPDSLADYAAHRAAAALGEHAHCCAPSELAGTLDEAVKLLEGYDSALAAQADRLTRPAAEDLLSASAQIERPNYLAEHVAHAAAAELARFWPDHLREGARLEDLLEQDLKEAVRLLVLLGRRLREAGAAAGDAEAAFAVESEWLAGRRGVRTEEELRARRLALLCVDPDERGEDAGDGSYEMSQEELDLTARAGAVARGGVRLGWSVVFRDVCALLKVRARDRAGESFEFEVEI